MAAQRKTPGTDEPGVMLKQSKQRQFTAAQFAREAAGNLLLIVVIVGVASVTRCTCRASRGTMSPALKSAGARHTTSEAVATPTEKRGFVTFKSLAGAGVSSPGHQGYGRDEPIRKDGCTASDVCLTSRPPYALRQATGGFLHVPEGA